ncbi:TonB-dependent receptor [Desulfosoma sp.]
MARSVWWKPTVAVFLGGLILCGLGGSLWAKEPAEKAGASQETGKRKEAKSAQLEDISVTATKTATPAELLPVAAHTVDREAIESQPSHYMGNFGELIRDLPGVHVAQYYPWGPPWVHLRGTGYFIGRTVFLVDGIPVTPFMSQTINNMDIERVDVILGPSSAIWGANASGGVVNIITRSGKKDTGARVGMGYGSFETYRPHASIGDKEKNWNYYFAYNGDYSEGYYMKPVDGMIDLWYLGKKQYLWDASLERNRYRYSYFMGKVGWENDDGMSLTATYNMETLYLFGGQPGLILNDDGLQGIGSLKFQTPVTDWLHMSAYLGQQHFDRPGRNINGLSLVNGNLKLDTTPTTRTTWENDRIPAELQADIHYLPNSILTLGAFWSREKETRESYRIKDEVRTDKSEYTTDQWALYAQNQSFFLHDKLSVLAGIRWDNWEYHDIFDQASNPQRPEDIDKDHVTYRGGIKYRFNDLFAVRSSAGTAFWPGTALWFFRNVTQGKTQREANPNLKPEKTWMVDLGLELSLQSTKTFFTVTPYYGEIEDMVSYRYDPNPNLPGGTIIRSLNLGKAEIYGVEFGLEQPLTDELRLFGALTLNRSRLKESGPNTGNQLRNAPDYWGSVGVRYLNPQWVNAQGTIRFSDDRYYDDDNTDLPYFHMESYVTFDAKVWRDWKIGKNWTLTTALSGNNLFDKDYATEIVYVHPGRTVQADVYLKYNF